MNELLFVLGLPRSGTTLLQEHICNLTGSPKVPESWFFVNYFSTLDYVSFSEVGQAPMRRGLNSFMFGDDVSNCRNIQNQHIRKERALLSAIYMLYVDKNFRVDDPDLLIVEKTPRNLLIYHRLKRIFPLANNICIIRSPLDIMMSISGTWGRGLGLFSTNLHKIDMQNGAEQLIQALDDGMFSIKYEEFVKDPSIVEKHPLLRKYVNRDEERSARDGENKLGGSKMGDPNFGVKYTEISSRSVGVFKNKLPQLTVGELLYIKRYFRNSPALLKIMKRFYRKELQLLLIAKGKFNIQCIPQLIKYLASIILSKVQVKIIYSLINNRKIHFLR